MSNRGMAKVNNPKPKPEPARPLWCERDVLGYLGVSRTTLWDYCKRRGFPAAVLLGGSRKRWRPDAVEAWVAQQPRVGAAA